MAKDLVFRSYTNNYKQIVKQKWYADGRQPISDAWCQTLPPDELGRVVEWQAVRRWRNDELWDLWADEMDARAMAIVEDDIITQKANMLKRHANDAWELQKSAMKYLQNNGFDSSSSAVAAFIKGAELERTSRGIGEMIVKMAQMDNGQIKDKIMEYIQRASDNNQIIDTAEVPEKDEDKKE